ncbi:MAG: SpoIIE family protein phosphatase [Clostridia bacterium]|nr:SpoIIE family protein phosphatase [Clostridia bacterium]
MVANKIAEKIKIKGWGKPLAFVLLGFLAAKCDFLEQTHPLGVSVLCALAFNKNFFSVFLGALAGSITLGSTFREILVFALPCALASPILILFRKYRIENLWAFMLCCLLSYSLPAFILSLSLGEKTVMIFQGLISACLYPICKRIYTSCIELESRLSLERADILAISTLGGLAITSLPKTDFYGFNLCLFAILFSCSLAVSAFEIGGSIWCAVCALMWVIKGGDVTVALCLLAGGVFAGMLSNKRGGALLGFVLGDMVISLFLLNAPILSCGIINVLAGCAYTVFLKKEFLLKIKRLSGIHSGVNDLEMNYIEGLRVQQKSKIENAARMYLELSKAFTSVSRGKEFQKQLVEETIKVCKNCNKYEYCHKSRKSDTVLELNSAAEEIIKTERLYAMPLTLTARCVQPINLVCSMQQSFERMSLAQRENPTQEGELAMQLKGISQMLFSLAEDISALPEFDVEKEKQVKNVLSSRIGNVDKVSCRKSGESHILQISLMQNKKDIKEEICSALEDGFVGRYRFISGGINKQGGFSGMFAPVPKFTVSAYACRSNKKGESVCGDSFTFGDVVGDKYIAAISDGAGSGERAARESESALDLLEAFSETHISRKEIFASMNRLLLLKGDNEAYSTIDVAEFDLNEGLLFWTKIGAVPGYILRSGNVEKIEAGALPMGILTKINPITTKKLVQKGDVIVLVTDGVYDGMCLGNSDGIKDMLSENATQDPQELAQNILEKAKETIVDDDMTVLVLKVDAA